MFPGRFAVLSTPGRSYNDEGDRGNWNRRKADLGRATDRVRALLQDAYDGVPPGSR
ncbi:MAG: hypothetical protein AAGA23_15835 [Pseudomonadota bacterium]